MKPLEGITVVALEQAIAAPFCTRQLAEIGARVIKVERPTSGDFARHYDNRVNGLSSHFVWANRSKESLTLDIKHPEAAEILRRLLAKADVLVQNLAPGASERAGLSFDALKIGNPGLIVCDISGYGADGPYRDRKAYDLLIQSESGLLSVTGTEHDVCKAGCSIADISAGMYAYSSILAAVIQRGRTGQGRRIDISMLESMTEWMSFPLYFAFQGASPPPRAGASHATIYPYGPFRTGDGKQLMLGLQNEREWKVFCEVVLSMPSLARDESYCTNQLRVAAREQLDVVIHSRFAQYSSDQLLDLLDRAGIANAHVNDMSDVWAHPQLQARNRWFEVDTPAGKIPALLPPGASSPDDISAGAVPGLGQHTDSILLELGYPPDAIARYHKAGVA